MIIRGVDPRSLRAGRVNLISGVLDIKRQRAVAGIARPSMIEVTVDGVLWDGNHAVRVAIEMSRTVDVLVVKDTAEDCGQIMDLPITPR